MLESFGARKYVSTGIIQWMLNNSWPGMIWHLYDYYLRPGGSYFGAKKAGEAVHVQYSYDDRSVAVVNHTLRPYSRLRVTARVVDTNGEEKLRREATVDVAADGVARALELPAPDGLAGAYFVALTLADAKGLTLSRNDYWLSTKPETLDWAKSEWYYTPVAEYADLTALQRLPAADVAVRARFTTKGADGEAVVTLENRSKSVAFLVHAAVRRGASGEEILPVLWSDNYVTLFPGETREIVATYAAGRLGAGRPSVTVDGWNVAAGEAR
jgi:exo-1,4-beta-D-glucosaminidase